MAYLDSALNPCYRARIGTNMGWHVGIFSVSMSIWEEERRRCPFPLPLALWPLKRLWLLPGGMKQERRCPLFPLLRGGRPTVAMVATVAGPAFHSFIYSWLPGSRIVCILTVLQFSQLMLNYGTIPYQPEPPHNITGRRINYHCKTKDGQKLHNSFS
jgi:hypothetical protein